MSKDMDIAAVKIGPVVIGEVTERKPGSGGWNLITWILTVVLIASASPFAGFVLIICTAMYLAAVAADRHLSADTEENPHD